MTTRHWITLLIVLIIGYLIGVKAPAYGQMALSKVGL